MTHDDEQFWQRLRRHEQQARAQQAAELAAAERLLQDTEVTATDRPTDERIEAIVQQATAGGTDRDEEPEPRLRRWLRFPQPPRWLAAAAAFLLAPKFLAAATVATAVVVTVYVVRYSTFTLSYQDAIAVLMDERQPEQSRRSGQQVVFADVLESIPVVRAVELEDSPLAAVAAAVLERLRAALVDTEPFRHRHLADAPLRLAGQLADQGLPLAERAALLQALAVHLVQGMQALQAIRSGAAAAPPGLANDNAIALAQLATMLAR